MANICMNTLNAEGTPKQIEELKEKLSEAFGYNLVIDDDFAVEEKAYATLSISSCWEVPKKELQEVTRSLSNTENLSMRITGEEPRNEYFERGVFKNSVWNFEDSPEDEDTEDKDIWYCEECGSKNVEIKQWVRPNEGGIAGGNDSPDKGDCWCEDCQEHTNLEICKSSEYPEILKNILEHSQNEQ